MSVINTSPKVYMTAKTIKLHIATYEFAPTNRVVVSDSFVNASNQLGIT